MALQAKWEAALILVTLTNTDQGDLTISVNDLNLPGSPIVLPPTRLNRDDTITFNAQQDGNDHIHYEWHAQLFDDATKTADHDSTNTDQNVTTFFG